MAKIQPKKLSEIKKTLDRPLNLETATKEELFKYLRRLEKTVNSRIRRLREKVDDSSTLDELYRMLDFTTGQDPVTEAGFVRTKTGSINDYKLIIRSMESFLAERGSTITGLKAMAGEFMGMFGRGMGYDLEDETLDLGKIERATKIAATRNYELSDLYWLAMDIRKKGGTFNDYRRAVDNIYLVDDDLEALLDVIWNSPNVKNYRG